MNQEILEINGKPKSRRTMKSSEGEKKEMITSEKEKVEKSKK